MAHFFREPDRRQRFLLPVDMMDWLPEGDIVHVVVDGVGLMDLSDFEATCKVGRAGQPPFAPAMLLALLIYAYSHGVRSSRAVERLCRRNAGYRFIVGDDVPDHSVIAHFRQRHAERMKGVFLQVLELCREAGLIRLGLVALDGTKVKANASLDANRTASPIGEQIDRVLAEAEATDAREDRQFGPDANGPAMPGDLKRRGQRLARLKACQEKLQAQAAAAADRQEKKIAAREAEEKATGRRKRGRKPKGPDPSVDPDTVANTTDPESGILKTRRGWVQGYNAQAVVTTGQTILAADVTTEANDVRQFIGMLDQAQANAEAVLGEEAVLGAAVADAGYWSEANAESQTEECELFIATQKDHKQRAALREAPSPRGRMPKSMTARERMDRKLRTKRGRGLYRQRGASVEPVFGQMKDRQDAGRFSMRGLELCRGEWQLQAAVHNLRKLHRESVRRTENAG
ncbi:MAG: transposase [Novosphingobium sp.]|uniref:transposase n=1 Tax=Novosphingobium sp. TaxID=1874826 RepID=UPI003B9BA9BB